MALYGQHVEQASPQHPALQSRGPSATGQAGCLTIHGQRALSSLGVTLQAICRSGRLSPRLHLPVPLLAPLPGLAGPGAQPSLLPLGHTERGAESGGRGRRSASQGAQPALYSQQRPPVGREGWQTALCVLHGPHSWKQGERGKRPLQSQQSRLFIPLFVRSFRLKRLSRSTQLSALKKWANWIWTQGQPAAVSKKRKMVLIPWIGDQSTACAPRSFPVGSPPILLRGCPVGKLWGHSSGGLAEVPGRSGPPAQNCPSHMQGVGSCWHKPKAISTEGK